MNLKIKLLSEKAKAPELKDGVLYFYRASALTGLGEDGRVIPVIGTDVEIELPSGVGAMFVPSEDLFVKSIMFAGGQGILAPGFKGVVSASFKIDTPSLAVIPEDGAIAFGLLLYNAVETSMDVEEYTKEAEEAVSEEVVEEPAKEETINE